MTIRRIHIASFGPLRDFDCELYSGMNVIRGDNESGKTSLAMFIKFIFYGLSGRSIDGAPSERKKYVNWDTGMAEGYIVVGHDGREYRIERSLSVSVRAGSDKESVRESITVTDTATGGRVAELEECPGIGFFGVPEQVFVNTVFSGQSGRSRIDGNDTAAAIENLLFSADETVNVKKAAEKIEKYRRTLLHKKGGGGEIPAIKEKCADLKSRFDIASENSAEIIDLENAIVTQKKTEQELVQSIEWENTALRYYEAEKLCREGAEARSADKTVMEAESELRSALSMCCESSRLEDGRRLYIAIEGERSGESEFGDRLTELEVGVAGLSDSDLPGDPVALQEEFARSSVSARRSGILGIVCVILAVIAGGGAALLYVAKSSAFLACLAAAAVFAVLFGIFFILRKNKISKMSDICEMFDADDEDGIAAAVEYQLSRRDEAEQLSRRADSVRMSLEQSRERIEALETEAEALSASFESCCKAESGDVSDDPLERLGEAIALAEQRRSTAEEKRMAYETAVAVAAAKWERIPKDRLASAEEYIRNTERDDNFPAGRESANELERKLSFDQAKLDALRKKLHAEEVELAGKRAVTESPAELWEELSAQKDKLKKLTLAHDAVILASETLAVAGENMRRGIIPRIISRASGMFTDATEGRYENLGAGSEFQLSAVIDGHTRDSEFLSAGTEDLAYVCLRIALATELFGDKRPPLIFDESLAFMDPGRSAAAKDALAMSGHQVLLFTCRPEDASDPVLKMYRRG